MTGQEYTVISLDCNRFSLSISSIENTHAGLYACALSGTNLMDNINIQIGSECMERKFLVVMIVLNQVCVSINSLSPSSSLSPPPLSPSLPSLPPPLSPSLPPSLSAIVPVAVTPFESTTIGVGRNITFHCRGTRQQSSSDIPQIFFWLFMREGSSDLVRLGPIDGRVRITENEDSIVSVLTLQNIMPLDAGTFTCVTTNPDQPSIRASSSVTLTVEGETKVNQASPDRPIV